MTEILEYITANYTWFLGGAIIILLAIIGSYADKTNFGQGKRSIEKPEEPEMSKLENKRLNELIGNNSEKNNYNNDIDKFKNVNEVINIGNNTINEPLQSELSNNKIIESEIQNSVSGEFNKADIISKNQEKVEDLYNDIEDNDDSFEESYSKLDEEFNAILPKKEIIEDDLLEEIDNLSLDKTQKFNLNDIPDLDDVELPEINKIKKSEQNIWKF